MIRRLALALSLTAAACGTAGIDPKLRIEDLILPAHPPPPSPTLPDGVRVKVLTYNLHGGMDATADAIGQMIADQALDVVGLEECPDPYATRIAELAALPHRAGTEGNILLSRTALTSTESVSLKAGRGFVHGNTMIGGVPFTIYVAHIGWNSEGDLQTRELVDEHLVPDPERHLLMVGDFNDEHLSSQNTILEEAVEDAFTATGIYPGRRISWPSTGFDDSEGSQLIDLVFYRRAYRAIVLSVDVLNLSPVLSDHKPTVAELLYPKDAPFTADPFGARGDPLAGLPFQPDSGSASNLLQDPGAEQGGQGWNLGGGAVVVSEREAQSPRTGAKMFTGSAAALDNDQRQSWGTQTFDLSAEAAAIDRGGLMLDAGAWMATGFKLSIDGEIRSNIPRPYDDAEIIVETYGEGQKWLSRTTSRRRDTLRYYPYAQAIPVPPGARSASFSFMAHHKTAGGPTDDAVIDDLYFAKSARDHEVLGGDRLINGGAESGELTPFVGDGFRVEKDGEPLGLMLYPPWAYSGKGYFFAGGPVGLEGRTPGAAELRQDFDLQGLEEPMKAGLLAIRWGAQVRTYRGDASIAVSLEVFDASGNKFGVVEATPVKAPEWTLVEGLLWVPSGVGHLSLVVKTDVSRPGDAVFADELFAIPERKR
ncbi:MAG: hypothetical protein U1E65_22640 [Myxococcota bacterium]